MRRIVWKWVGGYSSRGGVEYPDERGKGTRREERRPFGLSSAHIIHEHFCYNREPFGEISRRTVTSKED